MSSLENQASLDLLAEDYQTQGFVLMRKLIPDEVLDPFLVAYQEEVVPSKQKLYRQNTNTYEKNQLTSAGYVAQSFFDILSYPKLPKFKSTALNLLFDETLLNALTKINGYDRHNLMQTALFDANTETPAHQDWWYADSVPSGHMIGAWIALEDIEEEAGRFYVISGSQKVILHVPGMRHSKWRERLDEYVDKNEKQLVVPALKKGDVLFFNVGIIHGSLPTQDPQHSRKSLVGHYLPSHMTYGSIWGAKPWVKYQRYQEMHQYHIHKPPYSIKADFLTRFRAAVYDYPSLMRIVRKLQNKSMADF